jgi:hypothetical protein
MTPQGADLLVTQRASWGILPQTPVFSLRSARAAIGTAPSLPWKYYHVLTGLSDLDVQPRQLWSSTSDSAPSEARKRGSGGGSPRKHDELPRGPSDLDVQPCQRSERKRTGIVDRKHHMRT